MSRPPTHAQILTPRAALRLGVSIGDLLPLDPDQEPVLRDGGRWVMKDGQRVGRVSPLSKDAEFVVFEGSAGQT